MPAPVPIETVSPAPAPSPPTVAVREAGATQERRCGRCIYDENVPGIAFDDEGVCNYCRLIDTLERDYGTGTPEGEATLERIFREIRKRGRRLKYDCVVGVSGGVDSSYMLHLAVQRGLRPLAVHYDNTWNSAIATENIRKLTTRLRIDLSTYVVDNKEIDDIFKAFLLAAVPELDASTDIALAEVLYRAAAKHGVKYVLEGHSFLAEGVSPLGSAYVDGRYIASIHRQFGTLPPRTYPNMSLASFLYWVAVRRIRKIRPYWYIAYSKEEARELLARTYGWQDYGGHHLENRMTAVGHSFWLPVKFGIDQRNNTLSALVRAGRLTQEQALEAYCKPPYLEPELLNYFKKRLGLSDDELTRILALPRKSYRDYPTYKRTFERLRPLFFLLARANLVPMSFYVKYCSPKEL